MLGDIPADFLRLEHSDSSPIPEIDIEFLGYLTLIVSEVICLNYWKHVDFHSFFYSGEISEKLGTIRTFTNGSVRSFPNRPDRSSHADGQWWWKNSTMERDLSIVSVEIDFELFESTFSCSEICSKEWMKFIWKFTTK